MIYLILSILSSTGILLTFKGFNRYAINTFHAIVINYFICVLIGFAVLQDVGFVYEYIAANWLPFAVGLGILFIGGFYLISLTAQKIGATAAAIANKLSVGVPVVAAFFLYNDSLSPLKLIGICIALVALYCSSIRDDSHNIKLSKLSQLLLPLSVFLVGGIIDTTIKYVQHYYLTPHTYHNFVTWLFGSAFVVGTIGVMYQGAMYKLKLNKSTVIGGTILGIFNYGSIYFLVEALNIPGWESSAIFPINHVGIVSLAAVGAYLIFNERLSRLNKFGLFLAILAIIFIYFAKRGILS